MNNIKKIMLVFGTRPEAIKMAPLVHRLNFEPNYFKVQVCITAQHREMLDQVLEIFNIIPDIDLDLMNPKQDLFDITTNVLLKMREVLVKNRPDIVLVHGDTTTALATSVAAFYSGISVGHIEAGLRTHNILAPFPEEFNRQVTSKIAHWHFAPTKLSKSNLVAENVNVDNIFITGNTVIDALYWALKQIETDPKKITKLKKLLKKILPFCFKTNCFILITGHRRENFGDGFLEICEALRELASKFSNIKFVYPVHLNPEVQRPVNKILSESSNIYLIPPLDYEPFIYLLKHSFFILTDSGGIQEEAPSLGKPVLVMREVSERPEAIKAGTVKLVGANKKRIISAVSSLLKDKKYYSKMSRAHNPYGNGKACDKIVETLKNVY